MSRYNYQLPVNWEILIKENGKIIDLYSLYDRPDPFVHLEVSEIEFSDKSLEFLSNRDYELKEKIFQLGREILNDEEKRKEYNSFYVVDYGEKVGPVILKKAEIASLKGMVETATQFYQQILQHFQDYPGILSEAFNGYGMIYESEGKLNQAILYYEKSIEKNPNNDRAKLNLADILNHQSNWPGSSELYHEVLKNDQFCLPAIDGLIKCCEESIRIRKKDYEGIEEGLELAIKKEEYLLLKYEHKTAIELRRKKKKARGIFNKSLKGYIFERKYSESDIKIIPWDVNELCFEIPALIEEGDYIGAEANIDLIMEKQTINDMEFNKKAGSFEFLGYYYKALLNLSRGEYVIALHDVAKSICLQPFQSKTWELKEDIIDQNIAFLREKIKILKIDRIKAVKKQRRDNLEEKIKQAQESLSISQEINGLGDIVFNNVEMGIERIKNYAHLGYKGLIHGWKTAQQQRQIAEKNGDEPTHYSLTSSLTEITAGTTMYGVGILTSNLLLAGIGLITVIEGLYRTYKIENEDEVCGTVLNFPWWLKNSFIKWKNHLYQDWKIRIQQKKEETLLLRKVEYKNDFQLPGSFPLLPKPEITQDKEENLEELLEPEEDTTSD